MTQFKLVCDLSLCKIFLQLILWGLLILITFGLAIPFYIYFMMRLVINHTKVHQIEE